MRFRIKYLVLMFSLVSILTESRVEAVTSPIPESIPSYTNIDCGVGTQNVSTTLEFNTALQNSSVTCINLLDNIELDNTFSNETGWAY